MLFRCNVYRYALGASPPVAGWSTTPGEDEPEHDAETQAAVAAVQMAIKNALQAKQTTAAAAPAEAEDPNGAPAAPEQWLAVSDALYLLAALVEAGMVPPDAYPQPPARPESGEEGDATRTQTREEPPAFSNTYTVGLYKLNAVDP